MVQALELDFLSADHRFKLYLFLAAGKMLILFSLIFLPKKGGSNFSCIINCCMD